MTMNFNTKFTRLMFVNFDFDFFFLYSTSYKVTLTLSIRTFCTWHNSYGIQQKNKTKNENGASFVHIYAHCTYMYGNKDVCWKHYINEYRMFWINLHVLVSLKSNYLLLKNSQKCDHCHNRVIILINLTFVKWQSWRRKKRVKQFKCDTHWTNKITC